MEKICLGLETKLITHNYRCQMEKRSVTDQSRLDRRTLFHILKKKFNLLCIGSS